MNKALTTLATAAFIGLGALAVTAGSANAYIACNNDGDCWHADHHRHYGVHVIWHPDSWFWHHDWDNDHRYHWHYWHEGHGYWRRGVWIPL